jgi:hypothetical protein
MYELTSASMRISMKSGLDQTIRAIQPDRGALVHTGPHVVRNLERRYGRERRVHQYG